ncbi:MAG: DedA family protein [Candidatus Delongbacteria bacterium]|nr:DedA family protein [Candidatus Delongbacteria bacterium]MBN2834424.1 DedA family protein [Candidatus Delongbacteria bacterium]
MKKNIIRKIYDWVLHWAETPYGLPALFILSFAESSFFPVPPDVLLIALAVSVRTKAFKYAFYCTLGSILGGMFGYFIGYKLWYTGENFSTFAMLFFDYIPGFTVEVFDKVKHMYEENAFLVVFTAGFTPIPYKVITITAGVVKINFPLFIIASTVSRALRFFLVAAIIYKYGAPITAWIDKYFNKLAILFTILLIGGFVLIKMFAS